jgi:hypothetical protein
MFRPPWAPNFGWEPSAKRNSTAPINPATLTNLRAWYKSDTGTTIVTGVSQWNDQSGNLNHLVQAVGASQPVVTASAINGLPCITFDGSNDNMTAAFTLAQPFTIFMVFRQVTWTSTRDLHDGITTADSMLLQQFTTTPNLRMFGGGSLTGANTLAVNTFGLITEVWNGASSEIQLTDSAPITGNAGAAAPGGITLGSRQTSTAPANIGVAELVIMAATATTAERAGFRSYVASRYGF